jgi:hypothetical protein
MFFGIMVVLKISFLIVGFNLHPSFLKHLFELLGVKVKLSLAFHPQKNGQTK